MRLGTALHAIAALSVAVFAPLVASFPVAKDLTSAPTNCTSATPNGPIYVDATCVDPLYNDAVVVNAYDTIIEDFAIRIVNGTFPRSSLNFTLYLPANVTFEDRFIQFVYPLATTLAADILGSAFEFGAYVVQVGPALGYRHEAAATKFGRTVAAEYYARDAASFYGYIYGGSGGSYQTIGALENTHGVWQGAVPYILAVPTSIPLGQDTIAFATLVLEDKLDEIQNATRPGGSGDPYAGLSPMQQSVLDEVSRLGLQFRSWQLLNYTWASGGIEGFYPSIQAIDPTYGSDFWSADGYLGAEQSELGDFFRSKRVQGSLPVTAVDTSDTGSVVSVSVTLPEGDVSFRGTDFSIISDGNTTAITGEFNAETGVLTVTPASYNASIGANATLAYDNGYFIAVHAYHRYQVPSGPGYYPWDQYRRPDGSLIYPQRPLEVGPLITAAPGGGGTQTGKALFKAIIVQNLLDVNSFPWDADWYRSQVILENGSDDDLRIYYNDNADHQETGPNPNNNFSPYLLRYFPMLFQTLRDLALWVEDGIEPPRNTQYSVDSLGQFSVPYNAADRGGIQPVVHLCTDGDQPSATVQVGATVNFNAVAEVVTETGCIISAEWDFEGTGAWEDGTLVGEAASKVNATGSFTFNEAGTFFPAVRIRSSRDCDVDERYVAPSNLDRVRVTVV